MIFDYLWLAPFALHLQGWGLKNMGVRFSAIVRFLRCVRDCPGSSPRAPTSVSPEIIAQGSMCRLRVFDPSQMINLTVCSDLEVQEMVLLSHRNRPSRLKGPRARSILFGSMMDQ